MLKLKILEVFTQAYLHVAGFFGTCFQNKNYIAIIAVISALCIVAAAIGKAIRAITRPKR